MLRESPAYSGFSVNDIAVAKEFYGSTLGIVLEENNMGMLVLHPASGSHIIIYPKDDHQPATFTILNFPVNDIDASVSELSSKGVVFEQYAGMTDEKGIARGLSKSRGPDIAWFKDPSGNILSVLQES